MQGVVFGAAPDFDLPSANDFLANCADPFVVERIPAPVIIHAAKNFKLVLRFKPPLHVKSRTRLALAAYRSQHRILPNKKS